MPLVLGGILYNNDAVRENDAVAEILHQLHLDREEEEEPMLSPEAMIVLVRCGAMTLDEVSSIIDDYDIPDETKEWLLRYVTGASENTVNDGDSLPTQLAQVETKAEL